MFRLWRGGGCRVDPVPGLRGDRMTVRDQVLAALQAHRRHDHQQDVWLPMIRCECGEVMMSNRFRGHLADEITKAVTDG